MEEVFSVDESHIYFKHATEPRIKWVFIVLGNDGWDAISDYLTGGTFAQIMDEFSSRTEELA